VFFHESTDLAGEEHHEADRDNNRSDHDSELTGHPESGYNRIKREDYIQQEDLHKHCSKGCADTSGRDFLLTFKFLVNFHGAFPEQKKTAADQDQVATGNFVAQYRKQRSRQPHQPGK